MLKVSVVIVNFNGEKYLNKLISSIEKQKGVETEIIVVDRLSSDQSLQILKTFDVKLISEPPATGLASGYQAGFGVCTFDNIFFCNEDLWLEADCLKKLVEKIDLNKKIAAVDPWQWTYQGDALVHSGVGFRRIRTPKGPILPFYVYEFLKDLPAGATIPFGCAGAFLVHRTPFLEVEGWDCGFFLEVEDLDLCLRLWQRGWKVVSAKDAHVFHEVGAAGNKRPKKDKKVSQLRLESSISSSLILMVKYFPFRYWVVGAALWFSRTFFHLLKLQWARLGSDFQAVYEFFKRLPGAWTFRCKNNEWNMKKPGYRYFKEFS